MPSRRILAVEEARRLRSSKQPIVPYVAAFTAILALAVSAFQAYLAQRALMTSQRAWIVGAGAVWDQPPQAGTRPRATLKFINAGQSPALNVKFGAWVAWGPPGSSLTYGEGKRAGSVIGPRLEGFVETLTAPPLSEQQISLAAEGKLVFYVVGVVYYEDIFSHRHETRLCFQSKPGSNVLYACFGNSELS